MPTSLSAASAGAAGPDQVVDEQHALAALNAIAVHLEAIDAVLQRIVLAEIFRRQLAALPDRHEPARSRYASAAPTMKPRDSIAAILSMDVRDTPRRSPRRWRAARPDA
jgi:hypothetical protein